jgi:hypothetical protein
MSVEPFSREAMVQEVMTALNEDIYGPGMADIEAIYEQAVCAVDALVNANYAIPSDRWDEECHSCEQPIRDHRVDGRCPAPTPESSC